MHTNIILLHGALGTSKHWNPVAELLKDDFKLHQIDFPGHGSSTESVSGLQTLIDYLSQFVKDNSLEDAIIIGYSMGGYVALNALKQGVIRNPKLICIATKTLWNPEIAQQECSKLTLENLQPIADKLQSENAVNIETLIATTQAVLTDIGQHPITTEDIKRMNSRIHFLRGEKDKMVTLEETSEFSKAANTDMITLLEQGHLLERIDKFVLSETIKQLLR